MRTRLATYTSHYYQLTDEKTFYFTEFQYRLTSVELLREKTTLISHSLFPGKEYG